MSSPDNKKKISTKKTTNSSSKQKSQKKKSSFEKGKVYIPTYKIIFFCCCVIVICISLLLFNNLKNDGVLSSLKEKQNTEKNSDKIAPEQKKVKKQSQKQTKEKKKETKESSERKSEEKKEPEVKVTERKELEKKLEDKKTSEKKVPEPPKKAEKNSTADISKKITSEKLEEKKEKSENQIKEEDKKTIEIQKEIIVKEAEVPVEEIPVPDASEIFDFPAAKNHAQLVFVFDDGGQRLSDIDRFLQIPFPITVAVLPKIQHSVETAKRVRNSGNEVILHQPMQPLNSKKNPGPGVITLDMSEDQVISMLFQNINEIGPITGINNHEGSAITADAEKMAIVMKTLSEEGLYFLDSRTNVDTKVPYVAGEMGYSYYERNIFLDNEKTRENAISEIKKGLNIANKNGVVIMIGHVWSADFLPELLEEMYPELIKKGYTFATVSNSSAKK